MNQSLEELIEEKKSRSNRLQLRSIILSSVIILVALVGVIYAQYKVKSLENHEKALKFKIDSLNGVLSSLSSFSKFFRDVHFEDIHRLSGLGNDNAAKLASTIYEKKDDYKFVSNAEISSDNISKRQLNSHGFMIYSMNVGLKKDFLKSLNQNKRKYIQGGQIYFGDILFYKTGDIMLNCANGNDFCIGMTSLGVLTLRPDFAPIEFIAHLPSR